MAQTEIATKVDREQKQVHLESGQILPYDKLLIATGSRARVPVNTWQFIPNVVTLRNVHDCERLAEILKNAKKCGCDWRWLDWFGNRCNCT